MPDFQNIVSTLAAPIVAGVSMASKALGPLANPVTSRLMASGLSALTGRAAPASVNFFGGNQASNTDNWRVRISVSPNSPILYQSPGRGLLDPLIDTNGVIFPYTPQITTTYQAIYTTQRFTHSNYNHLMYDNSEVQAIQIQADFTAQTEEEARYVLACIYFFRAATKMFFGSGELAGNPPPLVFLNGYGEHYFPNVPCVVQSFNHTMPQEVDYIPVVVSGVTNDAYYRKEMQFDPSTGAGEFGYGEKGMQAGQYLYGGGTRIPTVSQFSVSLQPVYSKESITKFNLNDFAQGRLTQNRFL